MTDEFGEEELEAAAAAVERGEAGIGGGPSDQGWVVRARARRLWFYGWFIDGMTRTDEEREIDGAELRALLRRYGRKVIRPG